MAGENRPQKKIKREKPTGREMKKKKKKGSEEQEQHFNLGGLKRTLPAAGRMILSHPGSKKKKEKKENQPLLLRDWKCEEARRSESERWVRRGLKTRGDLAV